MSGLITEFTRPVCQSSSQACKRGRLRPGTDMPEAWYVSAVVDEIGWPLHIPFARQKDAELAKAALERAGISGASDLRRVGIDEYERIMVEAMQW